MEKMREEFEAWAVNYNLARADWGHYRDRHVNNMWKAWQASRAALYVELPEVRVLDGGRIAEIGYELAVDDFERALDAAGIRYV